MLKINLVYPYPLVGHLKGCQIDFSPFPSDQRARVGGKKGEVESLKKIYFLLVLWRTRLSVSLVTPR